MVRTNEGGVFRRNERVYRDAYAQTTDAQEETYAQEVLAGMISDACREYGQEKPRGSVQTADLALTWLLQQEAQNGWYGEDATMEMRKLGTHGEMLVLDSPIIGTPIGVETATTLVDSEPNTQSSGFNRRGRYKEMLDIIQGEIQNTHKKQFPFVTKDGVQVLVPRVAVDISAEKLKEAILASAGGDDLAFHNIQYHVLAQITGQLDLFAKIAQEQKKDAYAKVYRQAHKGVAELLYNKEKDILASFSEDERQAFLQEHAQHNPQDLLLFIAEIGKERQAHKTTDATYVTPDQSVLRELEVYRHRHGVNET